MTGFEKRLFSLLWATGNGSGGGGADGGVYGVEWDYSQPSPALTRTGDAAGFTDPVPATSLTGTGSSPFDNIMPWAGMRMCNIINGQVDYWQGDPQFSQTSYDTMVYIPEFWYKAEKDEAATRWRWSISPVEKDGYKKHPGSGRYVGRYHTSGNSSLVRSVSGPSPLTNVSLKNFRTYSHSKGGNWWTEDIATLSALQMLYLVEFANFNSQVVLGRGNTNTSGSNQRNGLTDSALYHTLKRDGGANQYRWIENPYTNIYCWIDGAVTYNKELFIGTDNSLFDGTTSGLSGTGLMIPYGDSASTLGFNEHSEFAFIPTSFVSNTSTYITDGVYSGATGPDGLYTGSNYNAKGYAGLFYFCATSLETSSHADRGARLIYIP